ncbi:IclR family transcriptional regulator [Hydrogenophaga sp.]|uniref:IclR family transcriptional regulator n=1 Tax=Hydrogenophaga sp. TaxID=1904254 RepID=UPI00286E92EA|nr:IclR family transcriptional regulator [Hydrogenophaga sp.]
MPASPTPSSPRGPSAAPDEDSNDHQRAGIQSVEVGFELLKALSDAPGALMLRDLAANAGMSAAKAHRYLVSFQRMGLVVQDPVSTRYDLGPAALRLGLASLARIDAVKLARERIPALLGETGHTLAIAVWGNQGPTMVHWAEAPQSVPVTLRLGDVMPLLTSATGRCFAAFMPAEGRDGERIPAMIREELARLKQLPQTGLPLVDVPQSPADVQALLQDTRHQGLGRVVHSLLPGVGGFCAPVFDAQGRLALGLVVLGSVATLDTGWQGTPATALLACARQLSTDLGYRADTPPR